jgi:hypothetical protein
MHKYIILFLLLTGIVLSAKAQNPELNKKNNSSAKSDSVYRKIDSAESKPFVPRVRKEKTYHPDSLHSPHTAVIRSLILPGWGQWYNKHGWWWKIPAIYAGLGALGNAIITNERDYKMFLAVAKYQRLGINYTDPRYKDDKYQGDYKKYDSLGVSQDAIINAKDGSLRNRDISILSFLAVWTVNLIDAYIDAKFIHSFSMDNNFNVRVTGTMMNQPVYGSNFNANFNPGLKITLTLK